MSEIIFTDDLSLTLNEIKHYCESLSKSGRCGPECNFWTKHEGCWWRKGKTPNEWGSEE